MWPVSSAEASRTINDSVFTLGQKGPSTSKKILEEEKRQFNETSRQAAQTRLAETKARKRLEMGDLEFGALADSASREAKRAKMEANDKKPFNARLPPWNGSVKKRRIPECPQRLRHGV
ncbi:hypothetical protein BV898_05249 [Hypsibius exemplaris]|uniref:Uncharacterized protein n=1 Tax=Hypsibius exemplaris TaxID=2072580 RepID=A0A1W0WZR7_HYPEX|nr:hypothetical protein BV898_05249 [Hypsibius exemplaris]